MEVAAFFKPMTLDQFCALRPTTQLTWVLAEGRYLTQRWDQAGATLYYLDDGGRGYFVEIGVDEGQQCFVVLRSFCSQALLAEYAASLPLPEGL